MNRESVEGYNRKQLPAVAIVSVTRNRVEMLLRVLSQVRELDYPKELLDFYLLDNASTDQTVEKVKLFFPEVRITSSASNLGPTPGWNVEIKQVLESETDYKYIWLLDSDAEIEKQTLISMVEVAESDSKIAAIGSAVYELDERNKLITMGLNIDWAKPAISYHISKNEGIGNLIDVQVLPACSLIVRTDLYRKLGILDDRLRLYWGDTEWCIRAQKNGYRVCCLGKSKVWHRDWESTKRYFFTPFAIHSSIRGARLFFL